MKSTAASLKILLFLSLILFIGYKSPAAPIVSEIKAQAYAFLKAFYTADMARAKSLAADEDTFDFLSDIHEFIIAEPLPDSVRELQMQIKIDIKDNDVKVEGDNATVTYMLSPPPSIEAPSIQKQIKMVKADGKWLASYSMEDYMAEMQAEMEKYQQQRSYVEDIIKSAEEAVAIAVIDDTIVNIEDAMIDANYTDEDDAYAFEATGEAAESWLDKEIEEIDVPDEVNDSVYETAEIFLNSYYHLNFDMAKNYATPESQDFLNELENFVIRILISEKFARISKVQGLRLI